jgi:hypothetical protein
VGDATCVLVGCWACIVWTDDAPDAVLPFVNVQAKMKMGMVIAINGFCIFIPRLCLIIG